MVIIEMPPPPNLFHDMVLLGVLQIGEKNEAGLEVMGMSRFAVQSCTTAMPASVTFLYTVSYTACRATILRLLVPQMGWSLLYKYHQNQHLWNSNQRRNNISRAKQSALIESNTSLFSKENWRNIPESWNQLIIIKFNKNIRINNIQSQKPD